MLVTGGTGKVGNAVIRAAQGTGREVRALVRDRRRASTLLPEEVELVAGDVTDPNSLERAVDGCEVVFNAMGLPEQWLPDEAAFETVNVQGSANLARAAASLGVRRFVHTSTIDVFEAPPGGRFDETSLAAGPKGTAYERSKQRAERAVLDAAGGLEIVFVNPAGVYGPGPAGSASLERQLFPLVLRGLLPAVPPGGFGVVFTEGLGRGHLLASERGRPGERYILCDQHVTMMQLAKTIVAVARRGRVPRLTMPVRAAKAIATSGEALARITRRPPLLARGQLDFLLWNATPDSTKAQEELGWVPTTLEAGVRRTIEVLGLG